MPKQIPVLYLNGLERTHRGAIEWLMTIYLRLRGIRIIHGEVDWHSGRSFDELFYDTLALAQHLLRKHGRLAIVGASAGGSLAVCVFEALLHDDPEAKVWLISLSGRLQTGDIKHLLDSALHRPGKKPSAAFFDSVVACATMVLPYLPTAVKQRMAVVHPKADGTVPLETMSVEGVAEYRVPVSGHLFGIVVGLLRLPAFLKHLLVQSPNP